MRNRSFLCLLAVGLGGLGAGTAPATRAATIAPVITINGSALDLNDLGCVSSGDGIVSCEGTSLTGSGYELSSWSFEFDPDPTLSGSFTLTNLSKSTLGFTVSASLSILPVGPSLSATGSVGAGTLTDLNANGATVTDSGLSIYTTEIDGVSVHTLLDRPQSYTAPADPLGAPSSVTIPMESFGPDLLAQAASSSITASFAFMLTAGDSVSFPFSFDVEPVPEPATLLLLGGGIAGLALSGRTKHPLRSPYEPAEEDAPLLE